jgi:hypothetical protein
MAGSTRGCGKDRQAQCLELLLAQSLALRRQRQVQFHGQPQVAALVVEMAQALHVARRKGVYLVADGVVGHVGGVVAPGNIGIAPQIFENMAAVLPKPFTDNLAAPLRPGAQDHQGLVHIGQMGVVGHRLVEGVVADVRSRAPASEIPVFEADRLPVVEHKRAAEVGQGNKIFSIGGTGGEGKLERMRQFAYQRRCASRCLQHGGK